MLPATSGNDRRVARKHPECIQDHSLQKDAYPPTSLRSVLLSLVAYNRQYSFMTQGDWLDGGDATSRCVVRALLEGNPMVL
jgi:hypothetical protein